MSGKTVTVTDACGRTTRLAADEAVTATDSGTLVVRDTESGAIAARFAPGQWVSAVHDEHRAPDGSSRALGIARTALQQIHDHIREASPGNISDVHGELDELRQLAEKALEEIFMETEA